MNFVNGLDVSDWQGTIEWEKVAKAGYSFAYTKATEGVDSAGKTFEANYTGAKSAGLFVGAYHMFRFEADPVEQANHFLKTAPPNKGDLPPMIDLERCVSSGPRDAIASVTRFSEVIEAACSGRLPLIYLCYNFWETSLGSTDAFVEHPLWLANYTDEPAPVEVPRVWRLVTIWQHSQSGHINGIGGRVDLDRFIGSSYELQKFLLP